MFLDLKLTASTRSLIQSPSYALFTVFTLAIAIAFSTTAFAVTRSALFPPDSTSLVDVVNLYRRDPHQGGSMRSLSFSWAEYEAVRSGIPAFASVVAHAPFRHSVSVSAQLHPVWGELATGNYFQVLRVAPVIGRVFDEKDDSPSSAPVLVISHSLWQTEFGKRESVLDTTVYLNGTGFQVVGVAPPEFRGTFAAEVVPTRLWVPMAHAERLSVPGQQFARSYTDLDSRWVMMKGRLRPAYAASEATAQLRTVARRVGARRSGGEGPERAANVEWVAIPATSIRLHGQDRFFRPMAGFGLIALGVVVLIACTNLGNLTLARLQRRTREIAIRASLGASRSQLFTGQIVESVVLALAGSAFGVVLAMGLGRLAAKEIAVGVGVNVSLAPSVDWTAVLVGFGTGCIALLVFGLIPAISVLRAGLRDTISKDGDDCTTPRWQVRKRLVALQVSASVVLLTMALICGLRIREEHLRMSNLDLDGLSLIQTAPPPSETTEEELLNTALAVRNRIRTSASVSGVSLSSGVPLLTAARSAQMVEEKRISRAVPRVNWIAADDSFFATVGLEPLRGRVFLTTDTSGSERVALVSQALADRYAVDILGAHLSYRRTRLAGEDNWPVETVRIIGIVEAAGLVESEDLSLYVPLSQHPVRSVTIVIRATHSSGAVTAAAVQGLQTMSRRIPILMAGKADDFASVRTSLPRLAGSLMAFLGVGAIVLALTGMYGVLSYVVSGRRRELAIRVALGATVRDVTALILRDGLSTVGVGLVLGIVVSTLAWNTMARMLQLTESPAQRLVAIMAIACVLFIAGGLACWKPAFKAGRVDPSNALRQV